MYISFSESNDNNLNFSQDLSEIPSYDDTHLDDSIDPGSLASLRTIPDYDELDSGFKNDPDLDLDETLTTDAAVPSHAQSEVMDFKESHFKESSESGGDEGPIEVDNLAEGLESMPDVEEVLDHEQQESEANRVTLFGQAQAMIASDVVSNLMASTMTGMSTNDEQSAGHYAHYRSGSEETNINTGNNNKGRLTESVDSDVLLEEFEFLEEEDLDVEDEDNKRKTKKK